MKTSHFCLDFLREIKYNIRWIIIERKRRRVFGYVRPREGDLLVREWEFYRAAYCGLCRRMKVKTGALSTCSLSYDFVFYALSAMLLTDGRVALRTCKCAAHPCRGKKCLQENPALDLAARAAAVLSYEKLMDDRRDERGFRRLGVLLALPAFRRAARRAALPELQKETEGLLSELHTLEEERTPSLDAPADLFGKLLSRVFLLEVPEEHRPTYRAIGYHLGKFIYVADALDDERKDRRRGGYNPFVLLYPDGMTKEDEESAKRGLLLELESLADAVEDLPEGSHHVKNILKNTVYLGLPDRVDAILDERREGKGKKTKRKGKR